MVYKLEFRKQPEKFLEKQQKHVKKRFDEWVEKLILNPYEENEGIKVNFLFDDKPVYKKRIGSIRIFFVIYDNEIKILITEAQSRGQAYK